MSYYLSGILAQNIFEHAVDAFFIVLQGLADQDVRHQRVFVVPRPCIELFEGGHEKDQLSICTQDEAFKKKVTDDLKAALAGKANPALLKIMATSHVYNPLLAAVEKFCQDFDLAVENGHSKDDLEKLVSDGAKNVFGVALGAAKNLKVSGAKDCIIVAQKLADIMLNSVSPVAFKQNEYRAFGKAYMVMKNADAIAEMVGGDEATVNEAIAGAKEVFGELYPEKMVLDGEKINVDLNEPNASVAPRVNNVSEVNVQKNFQK